MADKKNTKYDPFDDSNSANWTPTIPGISKVLEITEGGHEGAKAVHEYQMHASGQNMAESDFRDYDDAFKVNVEGPGR